MKFFLAPQPLKTQSHWGMFFPSVFSVHRCSAGLKTVKACKLLSWARSLVIEVPGLASVDLFRALVLQKPDHVRGLWPESQL